jgi:hypothetical protein
MQIRYAADGVFLTKKLRTFAEQIMVFALLAVVLVLLCSPPRDARGIESFRFSPPKAVRRAPEKNKKEHRKNPLSVVGARVFQARRGRGTFDFFRTRSFENTVC